MEKLDTLAGGVVFGKEEAWNKLQACMDKKPAKQIPLRYTVAVAAILLLFVCIMTVYYYPRPQLAKNDAEKTITIQPAESLAIAPKTPSEEQQIITGHEEGDQKQMVAVSRQSLKKHEGAKLVTSIQVSVAPISQPAIETKEPQIVTTTNIPAPTRAMAVVHINDIENELRPRTVNGAVAETDPDLRKMPVLHINDVVKEDLEIKMIFRENRMSFGRNPFSRPASYSIYPASNTDENYQPHHLLKNIFNTQN